MDVKNNLTRWLWYVAGALLVLVLGSYFSWENALFWMPQGGNAPSVGDSWIFMAAVMGAYAGTILISENIVRMPKCGRMVSTLLAVTASFTALVVLLFAFRAYYSRSFISIALGVTVLWVYGALRIFFSPDQVMYGFTPGSDIRELRRTWRKNFSMIPSPEYTGTFDILVVSPHLDKPFSPGWTRYITNMMIQGIPMAHPGTVYEFFTGRMPIEYMTEGLGVAFKPPRWYPILKRLIDLGLLVLFALPAAFVSILVGVAALCTSGRPVFFSQVRTGKNGQTFIMYKFRTMTEKGEVTPIGRYLRKYRLDELPQFINVAKGDMSFIGPRPEVPELTKRYTEEISFYPYRATMLPGITGWAQVNYGYAAVTSQNKIKLGYDLYYIKHASFALDVLILLRTVRIIVLGFGK